MAGLSLKPPGPGSAIALAAAVAAFAVSVEQRGDVLSRVGLLILAFMFALFFLYIEHQSFKERKEIREFELRKLEKETELERARRKNGST